MNESGTQPDTTPEVSPEASSQATAQPGASAQTNEAPAPAPETVSEPAPSEPAPSEPAPSEPVPSPAVPSPAALGRIARPQARPAARPASQPGVAEAPRPGESADGLVGERPTDSAAFGRVAEDGTVYVRETSEDGSPTERAVGSYPGSTPDEALAYFTRKFDDLYAQASLLSQRVAAGTVSAPEGRESLKAVRAQMAEASVVGDLARLESLLAGLDATLRDRERTEQAQRAAAREIARGEREAIVAEAERIAAVPAEQMPWKTSGARMRELLDEWKAHQRSSARLDKPSENELWKRFSAARNSFDKGRRAWFARLDEQRDGARAEKERLVAEAERLATSTEWGPTAGAFKRLMQDWKGAGRASRAVDDALWERFRAAQDAFFHAKDAAVAQEDASYAENLAVKEGLLQEAEALLPVKDLERTKRQLRDLQDRWEAAGKVPRADLSRVEGRLRAVETAVRNAEDSQWRSSDPEKTARVSSFTSQLEAAVAQLEAELETARSCGDARAVRKAEDALAARRQWLDQARAAEQELGR